MPPVAGRRGGAYCAGAARGLGRGKRMARGAEIAGLAERVSRAGAGIAPGALAEFLRGVAAAPDGADADGWIALVAPRADEALRAALRRARDAARAEAEETQAAAGAAPLALLRAEIARRGLGGFVVPRADEHQGEYVPARAARLAWVSHFTGSAGTAAVLRDRAALFVDGRYTLQAAEEAAEGFEVVHLADRSAGDWLAETLDAGARLGFDPRLHTRRGAALLAAACETAGAELVAERSNPVDAVWRGQPAAPLAPVVPHETRFAGRTSAEKRAGLADTLAKERLSAAVLTQPDSIAWLLNMRGGDVEYTPLPLSFAILRADATVDLFIDRRKPAPGLEAHLGNGVRVHGPDEFESALLRLEGRVAADPESAAEWAFRALEAGAAQVVERPDPCQLAKAVKNDVELAGMRAAHLRDGAALARFLCWLDRAAPSGTLTEIAAADWLEARRRENEHFRGLSFPTISGAGPNGAIVHYRVSEQTNQRLAPGSLYLVDSGAQYLDGTTDVTRTVAIGAPDAEMRDRFTRVLKGHIAIATARFPDGTHGGRLDTLARAALWDLGLDYAHGTGHGVGSYLGVHEGPQRISGAAGGAPLLPGMIVSNEPGYYKAGAWGIRIENLVAVKTNGQGEDGRAFLGFETLTLAPIDRRLVTPALLRADERAWLDAYHASVRAALAPRVDAETAAWLDAACAPL